MTLRLRTFGGVFLEQAGTPMTGTHAQRRRLAVLACLAASRGAPVTRDKLLGLLWPERSESSARHSLSQLLYALRQELPAAALIASSTEVRLDGQQLPSDVAAFLEAVERRDDVRAAELYRGPFLDGFFVDDAPEFEQWAENERARLEALYLATLDRLARSAVTTGDHFAAIDWYRRRIEVNRADATTLRLLVAELAAVGDRQSAVRELRRYAAWMRELEDDPEPDLAAAIANLERRETVSSDSFNAPIESPKFPIETEAQPQPSASVPASSYESFRRMGRRVGALVAVGMAVLIAAIALRAGGASDRPTQAVSVLVGELESTDSLLALAVREALRAELSNDENITPVSDLRAREITVLMRDISDRGLRPPKLLEVGIRTGAQLVISGSAVTLGTGAQLFVQLIDTATGEVLANISARATNQEEVVPAVAGMGRALRAAIAHLPVDTTVHPLPAVTTWSLPALKSYAVARQAAARGQRDSAIAHAERALMHDSTFVLAHHLAGDLLWFIDQQTHAEAHLSKAMELSALLPYRERLVVRARYEQLAAGRVDSALAYWDLLRDAAPHDPLAYEGRAWTLRALGRYEEAVTAAQRALQLDPEALLPNVSNAVFSLLSVGDTAGALSFAASLGDHAEDASFEPRFHAALVRGDLATALAIAESAGPSRMVRIQEVLLLGGRWREARVYLDSLRLKPQAAAHLPRGLLIQGIVELELAGDSTEAAACAREALQWLQAQDLSAPANARLAERIGDLAARAGNVASIDSTIALIRKRDRGRSLHSYQLALRALNAARAFARGDMMTAADAADRARHGVYFSRSLNTLVRLEADARLRAGDGAAAAALYRLIENHQIADGDYQTWLIMRSLVRRDLQRRALRS